MTRPWNAAGQWMLAEEMDHLAAGPAPRHAFSAANWRRLKEKLHEERIDLTQKTWRLKPDPGEIGVTQGWASPALALDHGWKEVRVGQHWESQGFPGLDKWAWYRLPVEIPASWQGRPVYLSFEGVVDMYELYLDGNLITRRGDLATRKDTFSEKFSHGLTKLVQTGKTHVIAVRVHDWYGAGGIFRPVTLSTAAFSDEGELLK